MVSLSYKIAKKSCLKRLFLHQMIKKSTMAKMKASFVWMMRQQVNFREKVVKISIL